MRNTALPPKTEMVAAFMNRDASYEGVFLTGVRTTGIFCLPTCPARKPKPENVEFFSDCGQALHAGYRPCKRCRPLNPRQTPDWIADLLNRVDREPEVRWRDQDLRQLGLSPSRVRRWFQTHLGMTFHAYSRARRLGRALGRIRHGERVTDAAFDSGFDSLSGFGDAFHRFTGHSPVRSREITEIFVNRIDTPLGWMLAAATTDELVLLEFADRRQLPRQLQTLVRRWNAVTIPESSPLFPRLERQLAAYFEGRLREFDVSLAAPGTPFQESVWRELRRIPYGETRSYSEIATALGRPEAVRAVARANGDNRIAVLIPCHRVIAADGSLSGYGGGVWRKRRLLEIETGQTLH